MKKIYCILFITKFLFQFHIYSLDFEEIPIMDMNNCRLRRAVTEEGFIWEVYDPLIDAPGKFNALTINTIFLGNNLIIQKIDSSNEANYQFCQPRALTAFFLGIVVWMERPKKLSIFLKSTNKQPNMLGIFLSKCFEFKVSQISFSFKEETHDTYSFFFSNQTISDCTVLMTAKTKDIARRFK